MWISIGLYSHVWFSSNKIFQVTEITEVEWKGLIATYKSSLFIFQWQCYYVSLDFSCNNECNPQTCLWKSHREKTDLCVWDSLGCPVQKDISVPMQFRDCEHHTAGPKCYWLPPGSRILFSENNLCEPLPFANGKCLQKREFMSSYLFVK